MDSLLNNFKSLSTNEYQYYIEDYWRYKRTDAIISDELLHNVYQTIISGKKPAEFFLCEDIKFFTLKHFKGLFDTYPYIWKLKYPNSLFQILLYELVKFEPFRPEDREYNKITLIIDALLEKGVNPNEINRYKEYPLQMVVNAIIEQGGFENLRTLIMVLLHHGADCNVLTAEGISIKQYANIRGIPL